MMTAQCVTRDQLQEYLSGWTAPEQSEAIEAHLLECSACEQAAAKLEGDSDTFLDSVRRSPTASLEVDAEAAQINLAAALDRAKQVVEPLETSDPSQSDSAWENAPADIGSYELLRPIGHGGMGSVYLARHRQLGKQLAIKLLSTRLNRNGGYTARFQREMRAAGGLDHPAIVRATDAGEHNGTHYLAMEYIEGLDLSRVARLLGKFSIADACEIARQVALGLSHAHATGVTHRDIKPSNIMLSTAGEVKILDFGLARLSLWDEVSAELTTVGQLIGTLDYMAPEQADRPESVDYRADLYALGATLFRLLCGRPPLAASPEMSPLAKLRLLATHQPPSLSTLRPDAPEPLVRLVASLLARDPESRPASAAHVAEELAAFAQAADLPTLVSRAQTSAQVEPDDATAELAGISLQSLQAFNSQAGDAAAGGSRPPRPPRRLLAWALAPLALLAGVLITLETQKGNLVIESEAAGVSVKLLRDGKPYDELKIEPGATSTRLYAGQYEVTLDGGSDTLLVEGQHVEVRRGETTIARIRQKAIDVAGTAPSGTALKDPAAEIADLRQRLAQLQGTLPLPAEEPVYNGKPLSYWLDTIGREKSNEGYREALTALKLMLTPENAHRISSKLLPVLRSRTGDDESVSALDQMGFAILKSANPGQDFYRLLAQELEQGDPSWQRRIFQFMTHAVDGPESVAPLADWLEKNVLAGGRRPELVEASADYYQRLIHGDFRSLTDDQQRQLRAARERYARALVSCTALDDTYWLSKPAYFGGAVGSSPSFAAGASSAESLPTWYPLVADHIEQVAIRTLRSVQADRKLVVQALVVVRTLNSSRYDRTGMQNRRAELIDATQSMFKTMQSKPALLYEEQQLPGTFVYYVAWTDQFMVLSPTLIPVGPILIAYNRMRENSKALTAVELLALVHELGAGSELAEELLWVFDATGELNAELYAQNPFGGVLAWPQWELLNAQGQLPPAQAKFAKLSREHWVATFLHSTAYQLLPAENRTQLREVATRKHDALVEETRKEISQHDSNADGNLSVEEAKSLLDDARKLDANDDGSLSAEELIEFRAGPISGSNPKSENSDAVNPGTPSALGAANSSQEQPSADTSTSSSDEPLYKGKPLSYWLEMVDREKSIEGYGEALKALKEMLSPDNAHEISAVLLPILRKPPGIQRARSGKKLDHTAFLILREANPGRTYYELLAKELKSGDRVWRARIFAGLEPLGLNDAQAIEPLTEWLESNVFAKDGRSDLLLESANYYQTLVEAPAQPSVLTDDQKQWNVRAKEHYAKVLLDCEALDDAFWLAKPSYAPPTHPGVSNDVYVPWYPALGDHIEERAIDALSNLQSDRKLATQAAVILSLFHSPRYDRTGMKERRAEVVETIRRALKTFQASPAGLYEPEQLEPQFESCLRTIIARHQISMVAPTSLEPVPVAQISNFTPSSVVFPSLALLKPLIEELAAGDELADELVWVFEATNRLNAELFAMRDARALIALSWPDLKLLSPDQHSKQKILAASRDHWVAAILHGEAYSLLPKDIQVELKEADYRKYVSGIVANQMRQHDTDGDGQLNFEEAKQLVDDPKKVDTNGDQRITAEELVAFRTQQALAAADPAVTATTRLWAQQQIMQLDRNGDGQLSADEWSTMPVKPDAADLDRDGLVSVEEYARWGIKNWSKISPQSAR